MSIYVDASANSLTKFGEELCGDKVEVVRGPGEVTVVLADGLGSGVKANILATLTSKIAATMLSNGADIGEVVETVASTLPVCKERGIAYSTFTILQVDGSGAARLVEFDNPEAVLLREGREISLKKHTLRYDGKAIKVSNFNMEPGDACVLFSDGAVHAGVGKLLNFGWQRDNVVDYLSGYCKKDMPARFLTNQLLGACNSLYMEQPGDDTTVATVKVCAEQPCTVLVGPPVDAKDDCLLVEKFLKLPGKKVVCGGTTSKIVSRLMNRELTVDLQYESPDVPPVGYIEGIDLVTEGVVTLRKACSVIRDYLEQNGEAKACRFLQERDGASRFAKMLLEQSNHIHFIVGKALNPAHQNPDLPYNLSIKFDLVQKIAALLTGCGKKVFIEYC